MHICIHDCSELSDSMYCMLVNVVDDVLRSQACHGHTAMHEVLWLVELTSCPCRSLYVGLSDRQ